uniref:Lipoprotein n=1 Tax=Streptomyces sp. NBC_00049 TaxID=2903617 RepID=A0AAU2JWT2_9ACTN
MAGTRGRARATAALCVPLAALVLVAGCGTERAGGSPGEGPGRVLGQSRTPGQSHRPATGPRMAEVSAAWEGSAAVRQWREGFHPLEEQDWQPPGGFRSGEDKAAFAERNFVLRVALPAGPAPATVVHWSDGSTLTLPLLTAGEAYGQIGQGPDRDHALPVTGVRFGETSVRTSRGPARVPAWLFTVEGYATPLARIAIRAQDLPKPPVEPLGTFDDGTAPLFGHSAESPEVTAFEVTAGHGGCDGGVAVDVLEGTDTVVLAGRILPGPELGPDQGCAAMMYHERVPVTLSRPLGDRIVVDAASGTALEHRKDR